MTMRCSNFQAIGTKWEVRVLDDLSDNAWGGMLEQLHGRIEAFDKAYSRFRADSLVTKISQSKGEHALPPDGHKLLEFYEQLYKVTEGKVTPLVGELMADAGYDAQYSFQKKQLKQPQRWKDVLSYSKDSVTVEQPVLLDFGAAGKGYLVDIVAEIIAKNGAKNYMVNAGGDILQCTASGEALVVGLENPLDTSEAIGTIQIKNQSLCASSGSKRMWGEFHHIMDPDDLQSPREVIATWVVADDTMTADGLATALFFTAPEKLQQQFQFSYALLTEDMGLTYSKELELTLFTAE